MYEGNRLDDNEFLSRGGKPILQTQYTGDYEKLSQMSSIDIINLLASLGHGSLYGGDSDNRHASVIKVGTFKKGAPEYADIVVKGSNSDYGIRIIIWRFQADLKIEGEYI